MSISAPSQSSDLVTSQYPVSWQIQEYSSDEGQQVILKKDAMYRSVFLILRGMLLVNANGL